MVLLTKWRMVIYGQATVQAMHAILEKNKWIQFQTSWKVLAKGFH